MSYEPQHDEMGRATQRGAYIDAANSLMAANRLAHALRSEFERALSRLAGQGEEGDRVAALFAAVQEAHSLAILAAQFSPVLDPRSDPIEVTTAESILADVLGLDDLSVEFVEPYGFRPYLAGPNEDDEDDDDEVVAP